MATKQRTVKPIRDWHTLSINSLYLLSRNAPAPAERKQAQAELDRRRAACEPQTATKETVKA